VARDETRNLIPFLGPFCIPSFVFQVAFAFAFSATRKKKKKKKKKKKRKTMKKSGVHSPPAYVKPNAIERSQHNFRRAVISRPAASWALFGAGGCYMFIFKGARGRDGDDYRGLDFLGNASFDGVRYLKGGFQERPCFVLFCFFLEKGENIYRL
jgi:hypothetical protein